MSAISNRRAISRRRRLGDRRGTAVAEFAVCIPVILILVLGVIEATNMVFLKQSLAVAAYEGGRTAVIPSATSDDVVAKCTEILQDRRVKDAVVTIGPADVEDTSVGDFMRVNVTAPCVSNTLLSGRLYRNKSITEFSEFMKEF